MSNKAEFALRDRNPDVLSCIANLSNDEVFTSPDLASDMLDLVADAWAEDHDGANLWADSTVRFLDPVAKSGVFLREITKRLAFGLASQIPDLTDRVNHILTQQVYGIAITHLTSLLTRRSVYCSKHANGRHSIAKGFDSEMGNIWFQRLEHTWTDSMCRFCRASEKTLNRNKELETYAYAFIHTDDIKSFIHEIFGGHMHFDVIIGNPPYQLNDGGGVGSSAIPIYHQFVLQAKKLEPRYLSMVIPSRWFTGGRGLDGFRDEMLHDKRLRVLHDFINARDCFPGVEIKGGVCFFLWNKENEGDCLVSTHDGDEITSVAERPLIEKGAETFIRFNEAISILRKVQKQKDKSFADLVSANDPFGFDVRVKGSYRRVKPKFKMKPFENSVAFYYNGWRKDGIGYIDRNSISRNTDWIDAYKVFVPKAWGVGNMTRDWLQPFIGSPNSCCTETYLVIGPFEDKSIADNVVSYTQTKFFHFLIALVKITQNTMKKAYSFIPTQDFSQSWSDEELNAKYALCAEEVAYINRMVRPMNGDNE